MANSTMMPTAVAASSTDRDSPTSKQKAKLLLKMANAVEDSSARRRQRLSNKYIDGDSIDRLVDDLDHNNNSNKRRGQDAQFKPPSIGSDSQQRRYSHTKKVRPVQPQQIHLLYTATIRFQENADLRYQMLELKHLDLTRSFLELENRYRHLESEREAWKQSMQFLEQAATQGSLDCNIMGDSANSRGNNDNNHKGTTTSTTLGATAPQATGMGRFQKSTLPILQQELKMLSSQRNQLLQANLELRKQLKQLQIQTKTKNAVPCRRCHPELVLAGRQKSAEDALQGIVQEFHTTSNSNSTSPSSLRKTRVPPQEEKEADSDADSTTARKPSSRTAGGTSAHSRSTFPGRSSGVMNDSSRGVGSSRRSLTSHMSNGSRNLHRLPEEVQPELDPEQLARKQKQRQKLYEETKTEELDDESESTTYHSDFSDEEIETNEAPQPMPMLGLHPPSSTSNNKTQPQTSIVWSPPADADPATVTPPREKAKKSRSKNANMAPTMNSILPPSKKQEQEQPGLLQIHLRADEEDTFEVEPTPTSNSSKPPRHDGVTPQTSNTSTTADNKAAAAAPKNQDNMDRFGQLDEFGRTSSYRVQKQINHSTNSNSAATVPHSNTNNHTTTTAKISGSMSRFRRKSAAVVPSQSQSQQMSQQSAPGTRTRRGLRHSVTAPPRAEDFFGHPPAEQHPPRPGLGLEWMTSSGGHPSRQSLDSFAYSTRSARTTGASVRSSGSPRGAKPRLGSSLRGVPIGMGNGGKHQRRRGGAQQQQEQKPERATRPQSYFERIKKTLQAEI